VISAYAPQVGFEMEEKKKIVVEGVPRNERLLIGADFNGHVGEGNRGDEEVMGRYVQERRRRKSLEKQNWDRQSDEKSRQENKEMQQQVKRDVVKDKEKVLEEL
ncbi:hypothetical protein HF521_005016, partial [Silurus meridionalis]